MPKAIVVRKVTKTMKRRHIHLFCRFFSSLCLFLGMMSCSPGEGESVIEASISKDSLEKFPEMGDATLRVIWQATGCVGIHNPGSFGYGIRRVCHTTTIKRGEKKGYRFKGGTSGWKVLIPCGPNSQGGVDFITRDSKNGFEHSLLLFHDPNSISASNPYPTWGLSLSTSGAYGSSTMDLDKCDRRYWAQ